MNHSFRLLSVCAAASLLLAACQPAATPAPQATGLLGEILARGTLIVSTDPAYPPQSELKADGQRLANTKCAADQKTTGELQGFDIDVAVEIAKRLGVEACFVTPSWDLITAGSWAGRWDLSVGSMTVTPERMKVLYFAQPYYTTPAAVFVHKDSAIASLAALGGKNVGVCGGCTYESYLNKSLAIPGETINFAIEGAVAKTYDTDSTALEDLALGDGVRLDAVITAQPTGAGAIADGKPFKQLGDAIYFEYLAPAIDRASASDPIGFLNKVTEAVKAMHSDGTLTKLSKQYYGLDLTPAGGTFDLAGLKQTP